MSTFVFLTVIGAALLHASWNALIKGGGRQTGKHGGDGVGASAYCIDRDGIRTTPTR